MDGTDFPINEPTPFDRKWCSPKFKHAGLRYEIAICIQTGWIVWVNGPYPAGQWPDLCVSRDGLNQALDDDEMFVADGGYKHKKGGWSLTPSGYRTRLQHMQAVARARHECINRYFKVFGAFRIQWRHHRSKHGIAFYAAANLVQARIQLEPAAFQVLYKDRLRRQLQLLKEQEKAKKRKQLLKKKKRMQLRKRNHKQQPERRRRKCNHSNK